MSRSTISHADQHFAGAGYAGGINQSKRGIEVQLVHRLVLLNPPIGDVDAIITAAGSGAAGAVGDLVIDGAYLDAGVAPIPTARNICIDSTNAGDTTQVVTITGKDIVGNPQVEAITLNGTTEVVGAKAFSEVTGVNLSAVTVGNLTVGTSATLANIEFGLDARLLNAYDVLHALTAAGAADGGTFTIADQTSPPTATTGDARGTYNPGNAPNGTADFVLYYIPDLTKEGYGVNFAG